MMVQLPYLVYVFRFHSGPIVGGIRGNTAAEDQSSSRPVTGDERTRGTSNERQRLKRRPVTAGYWRSRAPVLSLGSTANPARSAFRPGHECTS